MSKDSSKARGKAGKAAAFKPDIQMQLGAVLFVVVVYLLSQWVIGPIVATLMSIYPAVVNHWSEARVQDWLTSSVLVQFVYIVFAEGFTVAALYIGLPWFKLNWRAIGFRRPKWSDPVYALAMLVPYYIVYLAVVAGIQKIAPSLNVNQEQQLGFDHVAGLGPLVVTFISLVVLPPFVEELLVRGFLYSSLRRSTSRIIASIVASIIFALGHLQFGSGAPLLWIAFIDTFILSLFLVFLRQHTGRLYASMTLHALKNFIAFFALYIAKVH